MERQIFFKTFAVLAGLSFGAAAPAWAQGGQQTDAAVEPAAPSSPEMPALPNAGPDIGTQKLPENGGMPDVTAPPASELPAVSDQDQQKPAEVNSSQEEQGAKLPANNPGPEVAPSFKQTHQQIKAGIGRQPIAQQETDKLSDALGGLFEDWEKRKGAVSAGQAHDGSGKPGVPGGFSTVKDGILDIARVAETAQAKYAPKLFLAAIAAAQTANKKGVLSEGMENSIEHTIRGFADKEAPGALNELGQDAINAAFQGEDGLKEIGQVNAALALWDQLVGRRLIVNRRDLAAEIERIQNQFPKSLDAKSLMRREALIKALQSAGMESVRFERRGRSYVVVFSKPAILELNREDVIGDFGVKAVSTDSPLEAALESFHSDPSAWNGARQVYDYWRTKTADHFRHGPIESFWAALKFFLKSLWLSI